MTTHRLGVLGCNVVPAGTFQLPPGMVWITLYVPADNGQDAGCFRMATFESNLTKLLPEEPDIRAVVLDRHNRAWQHLRIGGQGRGDWCCTVDDLGSDWEELNQEHGPLTLLAPDPFAEPVELPWRGRSIYGTQVTVRVGEKGEVIDGYDEKYDVILSPKAAKAKALALWSAAGAAGGDA